MPESEFQHEQGSVSVHELASRADALGIEGLSSLIDVAADPVKFALTKTALDLAQILANPRFAEIRNNALLLHVTQGKVDDQNAQAITDGVYELVGATRPDTSVEEPDRSQGPRSFWIRSTAIPGVGILEGHSSSDGSFYVNLSRETEQQQEAA